MPSIWQQRILRRSISHGKEVGLPWSTEIFSEGLWRARINVILWRTRTGRVRQKITIQLEKIWHPWAYIRKGMFQPKLSRRRYSGTTQEMVSRNVYIILSDRTMELLIPINFQDYAIDGHPYWETAGTKLTWVYDRRNTRHLRVTIFWMVW